MDRRYLIDFDLKKIPVTISDFLIIGGGIAGLTAALIAGDELETTILTKGKIKQSSTWFAQGGIAAAIGEDDSSEIHFEDTIEVGANLSDRDAVRVVVEEAKAAIEFLIENGAIFDRENGKLRLAREGGHSKARILHAGDGTGSVIASTLGKAASTKKRLTLYQDRFVVDLLIFEDKCIGALVFDYEKSIIEAHLATATMLATGGMGQAFGVTTNPTLATGDGFAMAIRAGADMENLEFIQFHPTSFCFDQNPRFLISETIRGEGAYLRDKSGDRFMVSVHRMADLAPRDVVCRAMVEVMKRDGVDHVFIDATHIEVSKLRSRFPSIYKYLMEYGYDLKEDRVPVSPAAHYMIGGVKTDLLGRTSVAGLYASGEVASTGVHGANRLASNSLLEGLVFSKRATLNLLDNLPARMGDEPDVIEGGHRPVESLDLEDIRKDLRRLMTSYVGIVRDNEGLLFAKDEIGHWKDKLSGCQFDNQKAWEVQNMLDVSEEIIEEALARTESIGAHYRVS